jgi:hypothetical protein
LGFEPPFEPHSGVPPLHRFGQGFKRFIQQAGVARPHAEDAWIDETKTAVGYEVSFNRYFYKPQPLRSLEAIRADILALERETEGLLEQIVGTTAG